MSRFVKTITVPVVFVVLLSVIMTLLIKEIAGNCIFSFFAIIAFSVVVNIALFYFLIASTRDKAFIQNEIRSIKK